MHVNMRATSMGGCDLPSIGGIPVSQTPQEWTQDDCCLD